MTQNDEIITGRFRALAVGYGLLGFLAETLGEKEVHAAIAGLDPDTIAGPEAFAAQLGRAAIAAVEATEQDAARRDG